MLQESVAPRKPGSRSSPTLSLRTLLKRLAVWLASSAEIGQSREAQLPLTRLAFSKRWLVTIGEEFKFRPRAFMPYRRDRHQPELSIFRIDDLTDREVWEHVTKHARRPGRDLHGRADFRLSDADVPALRLVLDETPPRHGNLVGWPEDKDGQLALAQELAAIARALRPLQNGTAA